jgi:hypothetical protein
MRATRIRLNGSFHTQEPRGTLRSTAGSLPAHAALATAPCGAAGTLDPRSRVRRPSSRNDAGTLSITGFGGRLRGTHPCGSLSDSMFSAVETVLLWCPRCARSGTSDREIIDAPDVIAEYVAPSLRVAHLVPKLLQLLDVISGVIWMWEVGCPEEAIAAAKIDHRGQ